MFPKESSDSLAVNFEVQRLLAIYRSSMLDVRRSLFALDLRLSTLDHHFAPRRLKK